ncbi:unnamed protein product [Larinioides sclopetarius]|uniref:Uncharacterized protein n=1 Tax=Larinioides sclopetarius TaxID=280406 RepID=A0AAV2AGA1_9ARAC
MAEGGVPLKPEDVLPPIPEGAMPTGEIQLIATEIDSLHMLFARELITYVMRRKVPGWKFMRQYSKPFPVTPFSYRIRHTVDFYLNKECINFDTLFHIAFRDESIDYLGFVRVIRIAVNDALKKMKSHNEVLRFLFVFAHFTSLAYLRGILIAPYFALFNMKAILRVYTDRKCLSQEAFYGELGYNAQKLIYEDAPVQFAVNRR